MALKIALLFIILLAVFENVHTAHSHSCDGDSCQMGQKGDSRLRRDTEHEEGSCARPTETKLERKMKILRAESDELKVKLRLDPVKTLREDNNKMRVELGLDPLDTNMDDESDDAEPDEADDAEPDESDDAVP